MDLVGSIVIADATACSPLKPPLRRY